MPKIASAVVAICAVASAALPANATPQIKGGFYQETVFKKCDGLSDCTLSFSAVSDTHILMVRQVDCRIIVAKAVSVYGVELSGSGQGTSGVTYMMGKTETAVSPLNSVAWNYSAVTMNLFSGITPIVIAYRSTAAGTFRLSCTIVGNFG